MIGGDPLPGRPRRLDPGDDRRGLALDVDSERLDMGDVDRQPSLAADGDRLVHRRREPDRIGRFVAQVTVVNAAPHTRFLRQRGHFPGRREALRRVEQAGRKAERALAHPRRDHLPHPRQLVGGGRPVRVADHRAADRAEAHIGGIVDPHGPALGAAEHCRDVQIAPAVIADEGGRHPLHEESGDQPGPGVGIGQLIADMGVGIDESGRDDHAVRVDHPRGRKG